MTNINFKQFEDEFGNIIQEFEVIEYRKTSNGEWVEYNKLESGRTYFNVEGKLYYKLGTTTLEMNMDFDSPDCGACFVIGDIIESGVKITGNHILANYSFPTKRYSLNKQTYSDGTCHYTIKDEHGHTRLEHSSGRAENIISQMESEIKVYHKNIKDYNKEVYELKIEMNKDIIRILESEMQLAV